MTNTQLSDCCKAPIRTAHWKKCTACNKVCTACQKPCDVFVDPWSEEAKDKRAFDIFTESILRQTRKEAREEERERVISMIECMPAKIHRPVGGISTIEWLNKKDIITKLKSL